MTVFSPKQCVIMKPRKQWNHQNQIKCRFAPLLVVFVMHVVGDRRENGYNEKNGDESDMEEMIRKYLGGGISVTTVDSTEVGRLVAFHDGWLTLSYKGKEEEINGNFVVLVKRSKLPKEKYPVAAEE